MGSLLPRKIPFQRSSINGVKNLDDMKRVFEDWVDASDRLYDKLYDRIEAGGMSTSNWDIREATAADVADGNAVVVGNLLAKHKTNGTRHEFEA